MTDTVFVIPGEPCGKGRPTFFRRGGSVGVYTPKKTVNYEALVKICASQKHRGELFSGAVSVELYAYFSIPKSMKKADRELAENEYLPALKKPDADNLAKSCLDGMNGIVYKDDAQVWHINVYKRYSKNPRVCVIVHDDKPKDNKVVIR